MILGSLSGLLIKQKTENKITHKKRSLNWTLFVLFIGFFITAASLSETARKENWPNRTPYNLFENMYRFGSFVFGGADVFVPQDWDVRIDVFAMFGGTEDKRINLPQAKETPDLIINGTVPQIAQSGAVRGDTAGKAGNIV